MAGFSAVEVADLTVQHFTVELDEETVRGLAAMGTPGDVLVRLARLASERGVAPPTPRHGEDSEPPSSSRLVADAALIADQREANQHMVQSTILAQDRAEEADQGKDRAEVRERKLQEVAEMRELFIGILGHDLRNPLGSILAAAATLLRRGKLDVSDTETTVRIIRSGQRITRMVTQLLDLTRTRVGEGLPIERQALHLGDICRNVVDEFEAPIQLEARGDLNGWWDPDRLAEVLSNLTGNAIEYAAPGSVVGVKAFEDGAHVVVEVSNRGDAIPADVLPLIFEPFRRARQREKSSTGNLGLGLYIAHEIVLAHGGTLRAASVDGTTRFIVRLPRTGPPPRAHDGDAGELIGASAVPTSKVRTRRILVVDDEQEMAAMFSHLLEAEGHEVELAHDGWSTLEAARTFHPEVIILDIGLPDMDGYEVARRLREEHRDSRMLLIAVTGYDNDVRRLSEGGFDQHLTKPPDMEKLFGFIAGWNPALSQVTG